MFRNSIMIDVQVGVGADRFDALYRFVEACASYGRLCNGFCDSLDACSRAFSCIMKTVLLNGLADRSIDFPL